MRQLLIVILMCVSLGDSTVSTRAQKQMSQEDSLCRERDVAQLDQWDFISLEADTIINYNPQLNDFFASLYQLVQVNPHDSFLQVPIIHFGDSHIQAGYMTEIIRRRLQRFFGNAGRGFIAPLKLAGTNEPRDYSIKADRKYEKFKVTERACVDKIGVSGVSIFNENASQKFQLGVATVPEDTDINYPFNKVIAFHDSLAPIVAITDQALMDDSQASDVYYPYTTEINLMNHVESLELITYPSDQYSKGSLYGFSLENTQNGVLYHSLGVNGACYAHWGAGVNVAQQSQALNPKLIIISMGANEASMRNFVESVFYSEIDKFVSKLKQANPNTPILLVSPAEAMQVNNKGAVPNKRYERVSRVLQQYAQDNQLSFFNLFEVMGGAGSSKVMNKKQLMQRDKIHFTVEGYNLQGLLIYNAIFNGYTKYVRETFKHSAI